MSPTSRQARARAAQVAAQRRRQRVLAASTAIGVVIVVAIVLVIVKIAGNGTEATPHSSQLVAPAVTKAIASVPPSVFDTVGAGSGTTPPTKLSTPIKQTGTPRVLYVGAEYCPYCAAERWAVAVALSRFGRFSSLGETSSSPVDVYPSTQTLSFHGATYSSKYLSFKGYETESNQRQGAGYAPLDNLAGHDAKLFDTYDAPPYVKVQAGTIPFMLIGGRYLVNGASYSPAVLQGKRRSQIAAALSNPQSAIAKSVDGTANLITAAVCASTGDQPAKVCSSSGVQTAASKLGSGQ